MALVKCEDCGNEVSDKAGSCPKCGAPIGPHAVAVESVQLTSKKLKFHLMLSSIVAVSGVLLAFALQSATPGVLLALGGLAWYGTTKARIWWHHH